MLGCSHGDEARAMATKRGVKSKRSAAKKSAGAEMEGSARELVILTGLSGAGKASALKAFEDLGTDPTFCGAGADLGGDFARGAGD